MTRINPNDLTATAKLTFTEDFNQFRTWNGSTGLDVTANVLPPLGSGNPGTSGYVNAGELQWYVNPDYRPANGSPALPNPYSIQGGILTIEATPADGTIRSTIGGQTYTSGVVSTYHEFSQTYGYFEMRAELPAGKGLWPAFWLMPSDGGWPPEIDVMEQLGKDPGTIYTTVHSKVAGAEQVAGNHFQTGAGEKVGDTSTGFHTYGVDWEPDTITWYYDGRQVFQAATPADANKPMYMIANLAVGGNWPGNPDGSTPFPADMKIDYLRAYAALPASSSPAVPHSDTLSFRVAQDAYNEDAQFTVKVDGVQVGGVRTANASHAAGAWDTVNLTGDFSTAHTVAVSFLNDANDGHGHDRNLYVIGMTIDGRAVATAPTLDPGAGAVYSDLTELWSNGKASFTLPPNSTAVAAVPSSDTLSFRVAQDAYGEDAQFTVKVDGVQVGGVRTAHAGHAAGAWDTLNLTGDFSAAHTVAVSFLNDANDGHGHDRNLYITGMTIDGHALATAPTLDPGAGAVYSDLTELWSNGKATFTLPSTSAPAASTPVPVQTPPVVPHSDTLSFRVAQDAYGEDARFVVKIDGVQVGGVQSAHASHAAGAWDTVTLSGDFSTATRVAVEFVNDAADGHGHDRNLYVGSVALDGSVVSGSQAVLDPGVGSTADGSAALWSNGKATFSLPSSNVPAASAPVPVQTSPVVPHSDTLSFRVAQDVYGEDARFVVKADGVQVGGVRSAHASHAADAWDAITLQADLSAAQTFTISFLNDANDGHGHDRNLFVTGMSVDGHALGSAPTVDMGAGAVYSGVTELWSNGSAAFSLHAIHDLL